MLLANLRSQALRLLMRIEWQGDETHYVCPSCRQSQMHGHKPDCDLAAQIAALHGGPDSPAPGKVA